MGNSYKTNLFFVKTAVLAAFFAALTGPKCLGYTAADSIRVSLLLKDAGDCFLVNREKSMALVTESLKLAEKLDFKPGIAMSLDLKGFFMARSSKPDTAIALYGEALSILAKSAQQNRMLNVYMHLAGAYDDIGNTQMAIEYYNLAIKLLHTKTDNNVLCSIYMHMGSMMFEIKAYEEAEKDFFMALDYAKAGRLAGNFPYLYYNIAGCLSYKKQYDASLSYLYKAVHLCDSLHDRDCLMSVYLNLGACYSEMHYNDSALYYDLKSLAICRDMNNEFDRSILLGNIGAVYDALGNLREAERYYLKGNELAAKISNTAVLPGYDDYLADFYAKRKDYPKAYAYRTKELILNDTLFNKEKLREVGALNANFAVKELENKNTSLREEAAFQKMRLQHKDTLLYGSGAFIVLLIAGGVLLYRHSMLHSAQKLARLEQKQLLAQINPHFIFNCLNSVQQFVVQHDIENANKYLVSFATLMRQTLDNSKNGSVPVYRELQYLASYLSMEAMRFEGLFTYEITCATDIDTSSTEIPSMVVQPFVENAINHGLAALEGRMGVLLVSFYKKGNYLYCAIDDNGIGIENAEKQKEQIFIKHTAKGMEMTRQRLALVSKLNGGNYEIAVINKKNSEGSPEGTTITIKFPFQA